MGYRYPPVGLCDLLYLEVAVPVVAFDHFATCPQPPITDPTSSANDSRVQRLGRMPCYLRMGEAMRPRLSRRLFFSFLLR